MERDFQVVGLSEKVKGKHTRYVLTLQNDDGEKMILHLLSLPDLESHRLHEILAVKIAVQPQLG